MVIDELITSVIFIAVTARYRPREAPTQPAKACAQVCVRVPCRAGQIGLIDERVFEGGLEGGGGGLTINT